MELALLKTEQGEALVPALRGMFEALWLMTHFERSPSAKRGKGYAPADQTCFLQEASLAWIWLDSKLACSSSLASIFNISEDVVRTESWIVQAPPENDANELANEVHEAANEAHNSANDGRV